MVPKGHLALADRREAQFRQRCWTRGMSPRAATSREATAEYSRGRLWSDKHAGEQLASHRQPQW